MTAIEKVQEFLSQAKKLADSFKAQPANFKEVKDTSNNILSYDGETPMAGMPVSIMNEAGERLPAPTADYVLEDGSTLKVQDGVIMEVIAGTTENPEMENKAKTEQAETPATGNAPVQTPKAVVESTIKEYRFQEQIDELKTLIAEKDKTITELTEKFSKASEAQTKNEDTIKKMFELVEKIGELPASESKVENKDKFKKREKSIFTMTPEEFRKETFNQ